MIVEFVIVMLQMIMRIKIVTVTVMDQLMKIAVVYVLKVIQTMRQIVII